MIERIKISHNRDEELKSFIELSGEIDDYYEKIWDSIEESSQLIDILGLISRINGEINILFVKEWGFERSVIKEFNHKAKLLFNETDKAWVFFHNSFRIFLIDRTAIDLLTGEFDTSIDKEYQRKLAQHYLESSTEPNWKANYHLFKGQLFDEFLEWNNPTKYIDQLLSYRPIEDIIRDIKLGIEVARIEKDVRILVKYLFALAEMEQRYNNISQVSYTKELLKLGRKEEAKNYLRKDAQLLCGNTYALNASVDFHDFGRLKSRKA